MDSENLSLDLVGLVESVKNRWSWVWAVGGIVWSRQPDDSIYFLESVLGPSIDKEEGDLSHQLALLNGHLVVYKYSLGFFSINTVLDFLARNLSESFWLLVWKSIIAIFASLATFGIDNRDLSEGGEADFHLLLVWPDVDAWPVAHPTIVVNGKFEIFLGIYGLIL